jgi:hypothetical protein
LSNLRPAVAIATLSQKQIDPHPVRRFGHDELTNDRLIRILVGTKFVVGW